ncbi:hypothetical protein [Advenella mimigardefordensis]|uniref:Putative membrane protein n=1 Tax=Advenella mimigardefordensis (strain DSM 17166 / LMG 22922 / DPN7) TaxID=1247726 RepID=W0P6G6_ADVMD|nr:hypothetical protein [Advenella mimigardefordensis]AHG62459.1 putative membrane protein [Advenella mimigardefordensis DPN7]
MKYSNAAVQQNDARLVSKTLLKLATPRIIMRAAVIIVTIVIWLWVAANILEFGAAQDYAILNKFNVQLVTFLQSINTYLWWAVVLLGTLIVYFFLSSWYSGSVERAAYKTVPADTAAQLIGSLSPEGRDVLGWVWRDRSEPINIGNLKNTKDELDNNRVSKLAQIREQERLLSPGTVIAADNRIATTRTEPLAQDKAGLVPTLQAQPVARPTIETERRPAAPVTSAAAASTAATSPKADAEPANASAKPSPPAKTETAEKSEPERPADAANNVATRAQNEPSISEEPAKAQPTVSTSEQTEPTIGRAEATHERPPRDEVKHTIT